MGDMQYGEYDRYEYRSPEDLSRDEQIAITKKALESAIQIAETNKDEYWPRKVSEIQQKLKELEQLKSTQEKD